MCKYNFLQKCFVKIFNFLFFSFHDEVFFLNRSQFSLKLSPIIILRTKLNKTNFQNVENKGIYFFSATHASDIGISVYKPRLEPYQHTVKLIRLCIFGAYL